MIFDTYVPHVGTNPLQKVALLSIDNFTYKLLNLMFLLDFCAGQVAQMSKEFERLKRFVLIWIPIGSFAIWEEVFKGTQRGCN